MIRNMIIIIIYMIIIVFEFFLKLLLHLMSILSLIVKAFQIIGSYNWGYYTSWLD